MILQKVERADRLQAKHTIVYTNNHDTFWEMMTSPLAKTTMWTVTVESKLCVCCTFCWWFLSLGNGTVGLNISSALPVITVSNNENLKPYNLISSVDFVERWLEFHFLFSNFCKIFFSKKYHEISQFLSLCCCGRCRSSLCLPSLLTGTSTHYFNSHCRENSVEFNLIQFNKLDRRRSHSSPVSD